jgi:hypothetical protein
MKGTVSPELRTILRDPEMRRRFISGFFESDHSENVIIDLGNNENVFVRRFSSTRPSLVSRRNRRKSRNIFDILGGK